MEIEVKILNIDKEKIREKIKFIGGEFIKKEFQINYMFDFPDNRLYSQDGGYVRIRVSYNLYTHEKICLLTLKKIVSRKDYKIAQETEINISDFENMKKFLEGIGMVNIRIDEKLRETYKLKNINFEIDHWAGLPPYLEVEGDTENEVKKALELLGYNLEQTTTINLKEALQLYGMDWNKNLQFSDNLKKELGCHFIMEY